MNFKIVQKKNKGDVRTKFPRIKTNKSTMYLNKEFVRIFMRKGEIRLLLSTIKKQLFVSADFGIDDNNYLATIDKHGVSAKITMPKSLKKIFKPYTAFKIEMKPIKNNGIIWYQCIKLPSLNK